LEIARTIAQMKSLRQHCSGSLGFVPTMGFLHEGHLSLVRQSKAENTTTATSIFVNPTQFGPAEDFKTYPRDTEHDFKLLEGAQNDIVFMPDAAEMYPPAYSSWVDVEGITDRLEGAIRPGHFKGVTTVVAKLFNIVAPHRAYFGQKDAQQALVIKKMVNDLNMKLEVVALPTVREPDGLAMSSRNIYLNPEERISATVLYRSLQLAQKLYESGERDAAKIRDRMASMIEGEALAWIDYISIASTETLEELSRIDRSALISLAIRFGKTRLIDNIIIP
jgi:pantoate--beta-alanine ligase